MAALFNCAIVLDREDQKSSHGALGHGRQLWLHFSKIRITDRISAGKLGNRVIVHPTRSCTPLGLAISGWQLYMERGGA
jgi:hypothetical protein